MLAIELESLSRQFGDVTAVDSLSFHVAAGEFFALLGPNGAGKTTAFRMLATLLKPTSGAARILGCAIKQEGTKVRSQIGVVFQEPSLDDRLTARENLQIHAALHSVPRGERNEQVNRALVWGNLTEVGDRRVRTFSGGMKRRLEVARALMHRPRVLLLDEPTVGLDTQGRRDLWEEIGALRSDGVTLFLTTHNIQEAEICDRVAIMDQGKLIAINSPAQLKRDVLGSAEGSLEEVFIQLTGRGLRNEGESSRIPPSQPRHRGRSESVG